MRKIITALIVLTLAALALMPARGLAGPAFTCKNCIAIYGDSRTDHKAHSEIVNAILKLNPRIILHTGDLVEHGRDPAEWKIFNSITSNLRENREYFATLGNHEQNAREYFENFHFPGNERWYIIQRYGVFFIVLDSTSDLSIGSQQYNWLESELRRTAAANGPVIVITHYPIFTIGSYANSAKGAESPLVSLFERYGVEIVFSGHDHNYQRFLHNKTHYIVTGGGGAPLHGATATSPYNQKFISVHHFCVLSIIGGKISVDVYDVNLNKIDEFAP